MSGTPAVNSPSLARRLVPNALIASGLAIMLPALPPHFLGIAFGPGIGGVIAGVRAKARFTEAGLLGILTGLGVAVVSLLFLLLVQFVRMSVPASSVDGTIFAQLDAGSGFAITLGVAGYATITAALGAALGGWLARRNQPPA